MPIEIPFYTGHARKKRPAFNRELFGGYSSIGPVRERQEDEFVIVHGRTAASPALLAVFDGIGGHARGELAAQIAARVIAEKSGQISSAARHEERKTALSRAFTQIHWEIQDEMAGLGIEGGTTGTAVSLKNGVPVIAHAGDCRAYLATKGKITQLTKDHGKKGTNMVTKCLGGNAAEDHDTYGHAKIPAGAALVLCSDGVYKHLSDETIRTIANLERPPQTIARLLVENALANGSKDNATAVVYLNRKKRGA